MATTQQQIDPLETLPPGVNRIHSPEETVLSALQEVRELDGLSQHDLLWLVRNGREFHAPSGVRLFSDGDPADRMTIILSGEIHFRRKSGRHGGIFIGRSGRMTGLLPFSRMKTFGGDGFASEDTWALQIAREQFPAMLAAIPSMGQRCVAVMLDRVREMTRLEQQSEKLDALGKLAANLAHELNNPASAAQRAASNLLEELRVYGRVSFDAGKLCLSDEQEDRYMEWNQKLRATLAQRAKEPAPLEDGPREDQLSHWLEERKVPEPWSIAPVFTEAGIEPEDLISLYEFLPSQGANLTMSHLASSLRAERMTGAVLESTARIFELIRAIQQYSHMDQGSLQDVDLAQSLDSTLSMLHYRLRNVRVIRQFDPELPRITANGSELNQVWMALLENALDAMDDRGTIRVVTQHSGEMVRVEIWDDGPGIPAELHSRIFEPFFTTKAPGRGPGLSLDAVHRIVSRYRGVIDVQSKPGETSFQIRLPLRQPGAY